MNSAKPATTQTRKYKKIMNVIPKTMKAEKFNRIGTKILLKAAKILPILTKSETKLNPLQQNEIPKLASEDAQIYKYRSKYTTLAYQLGSGNITWTSCISIGKMKINKIMYGVTYDPEMEQILREVDSKF
jgi:hypothetical protein